MASRRPATSPRVLAARVLQDIEQRRGYSNRVLSEHLERHPELAGRDRGLVTHLVYGVLRHRARLDHHIDTHARRPAGLKGEVRQILRVGALELLELHHPRHAALSEAGLAAAGLRGGAGLRPVIHAILRAIADGGAELDAALAAGDPLEALIKRWSIPAWIARRFIAQLGEARAITRAEAIAAPPPLDLRIDLHRSDRQTVLARLSADHPRGRLEIVPDQPQALRMHGGGDVFHGPVYAEGLISVQGLAAQQPAVWLEPQPGERVLDACAGMGGKTQQLAELMQRRGTIVAADADARRLAELETSRARAGLDVASLSVTTCVGDLSSELPSLDDGEPFDAVLLDAPCTGLGNLARHPEIRWWREPADVAARADLQASLLSRAIHRTKKGGRLVYAVCSFAPEEGPEVVRRVTASSDARLVREHTFTPEEDGTEGFYVARIERS